MYNSAKIDSAEHLQGWLEGTSHFYTSEPPTESNEP